MKKIYFSSFLLLTLLLTGIGNLAKGQEIETLWELCIRTSNKPSWFGAGTERGMAYNPVTDHVLVASRNGGNKIIVINPATGEQITPTNAFDLSTVIAPVGEVVATSTPGNGIIFAIQDIDVTSDGAIVLGNLSTPPSVLTPTSKFMLYIWANEANGGQPTHTKQFDLTLPTGCRLGDKIFVQGSWSGGTIEVWAGASGTATDGTIYIFKTTDQGANWTTTTMVMTGTIKNMVSNSSVAPENIGGPFYICANGMAPRKHDVSGVYIANTVLPVATMTATSVNTVKQFGLSGSKYLGIYQYRPDNTTTGNKIGRLKIINVTTETSPIELFETALLGTADLGNAVNGDIAIKYNNDGTANLFNLGTDQGFGGFKFYPSSITPTASLTAFTAIAPQNSAAQTFTLDGTALSGDITITAPTGFEVSTDGTTFSGAVNVSPTSGAVTGATITVRMAANNTSGVSGNITITATGAKTKTIAVTGSLLNPTYTISYDKTRAKQGDVVTITATFNKDVQDAPVPQIAFVVKSGDPVAMAAVDMVKTSVTVYNYSYTVGTGNGELTPDVTVATHATDGVVINSGSTRTDLVIDNTSPTYEIKYFFNGSEVTDIPRNATDVTVKAVFNEDVADAPLPKLALSGAYTLTATDMTKVDAKNYTYLISLISNSGTITPEVTIAKDVAGNVVTNTGSTQTVASVGKDLATVDITNISATYDGTAKSVTVTTTPSGLNVEVKYDGSTTVPINAGVYNVSVNVVDANYAGSNSATLTIAKAVQTITFGTLANKTYGSNPFALTATATSGLDVTYVSSSTSVATVSGNTVTIVGVGTTTFTASQSGNSNYEAATSVDQALTIEKANQTIAFGTLATKTYGDPTYSIGANSSASLPITFTSSDVTVATVTGSTVTILKAGTTNIIASQAGSANFNAAPDVTQVLTVNKKAATVTISNTTATFDSTAHAVTVVTTPTGLTVDVTYAAAATAPVNAGTYAVVATINNANLQGTATADLVIAKADQTITFDAIATKIEGDAAFALAASASSKLPVTIASANTAIATISGLTVTIVDEGTVELTASQAGDNNYNAAADVKQTLTISHNTGVKNVIAKQISVYPVPATNSVTVNVGSLFKANSHIKVVDLSGKTIVAKQLNSAVENIDISNYSKGIYFIHVTVDNNTAVKKMIIE